MKKQLVALENQNNVVLTQQVYVANQPVKGKTFVNRNGIVMRELFSGNGKASYDMGTAPIPASWCPGPPHWR